MVGGGNSAGRAAVYLASQSAKVWMLLRGSDLGASMSRYLVDRIEGHTNIEVLRRAQVSGLEGRDGILEAVRGGWRLITGCIDLRLKIRRGVCTEKSCIGVGAAGGYYQCGRGLGGCGISASGRVSALALWRYWAIRQSRTRATNL